MQAEARWGTSSRISRADRDEVIDESAWMENDKERAGFLHLVEKEPLVLRHMAAISSTRTGGPSKNVLRMVCKQFRDDAEAGTKMIAWKGGDEELTKPSTLAVLFGFKDNRIMEGRLSHVRVISLHGLEDTFIDLKGCPRGLVMLDCSGCKLINNLAPLAICTNLLFLRANGTMVSCLKPLSACTKLRHVILYDSSMVSCLKPLASCTDLRHLLISDTKVSCLKPLSSCVQLELISIDRTQVKDLSPLSACIHLLEIHMNRTAVTDLRPLSRLHKLKVLTISGTQVTDLSPLSSLLNLLELKHESPLSD